VREGMICGAVELKAAIWNAWTTGVVSDVAHLTQDT